MTIGFGAVTRTGSMVLLALRMADGGPRFAGRWEVPLVPAELPVQPYHAAAELSATEGRESLIERCERAVEDAAFAALTRAAGELEMVSAAYAVAVVVKPVSAPQGVAAVLRSHAWMHAAEGILYREAVLSAGRRRGWQTVAVDASTLPSAEPALASLATAAGRPWRRIEKDAARAALVLLDRDARNQ